VRHRAVGASRKRAAAALEGRTRRFSLEREGGIICCDIVLQGYHNCIDARSIMDATGLKLEIEYCGH